MGKISIHLNPYPSELLSSWILRYCKLLKTKYHTFFENLLPGSSLDVRDIDLTIKDEHLEMLAGLTYHSYQDLRSLTLRSFYPHLSVDPTLSNWVLTQGAYHRHIRNRHISYCPSCFRKDKEPYFRKEWRLIHSIVCTECECILHDHCPKCLSPVDYRRLDVGHKEDILKGDLCMCSNCGYDFRDVDFIPAETYFLVKQKEAEAMLERGYSVDFRYSHLYFDVFILLMSLLNSSRSKMQSFDLSVSKMLHLPKQKIEGKRAQSIRNLTIDSRSLLVEKTYRILDLTESEFISLCKEAKMISCFLQFENRDTPYWFRRIVDEGLSLKYSQWKEAYPDYGGYNSYLQLGRRLSRQPL